MEPRTLASRILALFRRPGLDADLDQELRSHLEMAVERRLRQGVSPEQARRQALLDLGGLEQTKQIYREQRGFPMIDTSLQDLLIGLRSLGRKPGFFILAFRCLTI